MYIAIAYKLGFDVRIFEVNFIFLIKRFFLHERNDVIKT